MAKAYEVTVYYEEPTNAVIQVIADSEDHARALVSEQWAPGMGIQNFEIQDIKLVAEDHHVLSSDLAASRTVN